MGHFSKRKRRVGEGSEKRRTQTHKHMKVHTHNECSNEIAKEQNVAQRLS